MRAAFSFVALVPDKYNSAMLPATYDEAVKDAKRHIVLNALAQAKGNYTEAARTLGIHANNLHRIIRTLDLKAATAKWPLRQ